MAAEGLSLQTAQYPDTYLWGNMTAYILNPEVGLVDPDENDVSVVVLIDHAKIEFLLTGDLEEAEELQVAGRGVPYWFGPNCCAEILKVAHHGSDSSTSASFLATVQPDDG